MIPLSMSKCGEFCRNLTFRCAIQLQRHFRGLAQWVYRVCLDSLCDGFGLFLDVFGAYFKAFVLMSRAKIKGHNRTQ
jgi:hypothetical protein